VPPLLDEQGRVGAAIECLRTALRVAPNYADAMFNLVLLLHEQTSISRRRIAANIAKVPGLLRKK
jgi:hypothetical protein